jgi:hypothetical protein
MTWIGHTCVLPSAARSVRVSDIAALDNSGDPHIDAPGETPHSRAMKHTSIAFVMALALAAVGCKKSGGDCAQAIAHSMEVAKGSMPNDDKLQTKMRDLGIQHCKDDKWSDETIRCMIDAKTEGDAQGCYGKLSPDQQSKMNKAAMELVAPAVGGPAAGSAGSDAAGSAGATPPAAGSDASAGSAAGSAGSGDGSAADTGSAAAPK